eukprot:gene13844-18567_t
MFGIKLICLLLVVVCFNADFIFTNGQLPTAEPTFEPSLIPSTESTFTPTIEPSQPTTAMPSDPSFPPTFEPTSEPTLSPSFYNQGFHSVASYVIDFLLTFYNATDGPNWIVDSDSGEIPWNFTTPYPEPCATPLREDALEYAQKNIVNLNWVGITCNCGRFDDAFIATFPNFYANNPYYPGPEKHPDSVRGKAFRNNHFIPNPCYITKIELPNRNLNGNITNLNFTAVSNLIFLQLQGNSLIGSIPKTIETLTEIELIRLQDNSLTGPLPDFTALTKLNYFTMWNNYVTGTIPQSFFRNPLKTVGFYNNLLTGTIPNNFLESCHMEYLNIGKNDFSGTIPSTIRNCTNMTAFIIPYTRLSGSLSSDFFEPFTRIVDIELTGNKLTGSLPKTISSTVKIALFGENRFTGTIPEEFYQNHDLLRTFEVYNNSLTGTISPSIKNLISLYSFAVNDNFLHGQIVEEIFEIPSLDTLNFGNNSLNGTLSQSIGKLTYLTNFLFDDNQLTGTLPDAIDNNTQLTLFRCANNKLTGELPKLNITNLYSFVAANNSFKGTIPSFLGNQSKMVYLDISNNSLTGSIPDSFMKLKSMQTLLLSYNQLTGPITNKIAHDNIITIDISFNFFKDDIPTDLFNKTSLSQFLAVSNCFSGDISDDICLAKDLTVLALDGSSAAKECKHIYFPNTAFGSAYELLNPIKGTIPECLFKLSKLKLMHLSGNHLTGSIPTDSVSSSLTDLIMSNNVLTGTIPESLQEHKWTVLDLSFNKLTGKLSPNFTYFSNDTTVTLNINRLSGDIPPAFRAAENVDILDGNLFHCPLAHSERVLPRHDKKYSSYDCGSNSLNLSIYIYLCVGFISIIIVMILFIPSAASRMDLQSFKETVLRARDAFSIYQTDLVAKYVGNPEPVEGEDDMNKTNNTITKVNVQKFGSIMRDIRATAILFTVYICVVFLPMYSALSSYYATFTDSFAWTVSALYLRGKQAAICIFVLLIIFLALLYTIIYKLKKSHNVLKPIKQVKRTNAYNPSFLSILAIIFIIDIAIIGVCNGLFIYIILHENVTNVRLAEVALAIIKLLMNELVVPIVLLKFGKYFKSKSTITLRITLVVINSVIIPCAMTAAINTNCFFYIISKPPIVSTNYEYTVCNNFAVQDNSLLNIVKNQCLETANVQKVVSYYPAFTYTYQCAASLISNYSSVFIYQYIIGSFIIPVIWEILHFLNRSEVVENPDIIMVAGKVLPPILAPMSEKRVEALRHSQGEIFNIGKFITWTLSALIILVTFGALFPPLAVVICISILSKTYYTQLIIGRRTLEADKLKLRKYHEVLAKDCRYIENSFRHLYWVLAPFCATFYGFIIFDTLGDEVGYIKALWAPIIISMMPLVIYAISKTYIKLSRRDEKRRRKAAGIRRQHRDKG